MAIVDLITIIRGTDRQFDLRIQKSNGDVKALDDANLALFLKLPGEDNDLELTLTPNANGTGLAVADAASGRITVTIDDTDSALLRSGDGQSMELTIQEGAGPNFTVSKVQYVGKLSVKEMLFES